MNGSAAAAPAGKKETNGRNPVVQSTLDVQRSADPGRNLHVRPRPASVGATAAAINATVHSRLLRYRRAAKTQPVPMVRGRPMPRMPAGWASALSARTFYS
jgi:hypothetical protein